MPERQKALAESGTTKNAEPPQIGPAFFFKSELTVIILPVQEQEQELVPVQEQGPLLGLVQVQVLGPVLEQAPLLGLEHLAQSPVPLAEMFPLPIFLRIFGNLPITPDS